MAKIEKIEFRKGTWAGNHWTSIDVFTNLFDDYDIELFQIIFDFICTHFSGNIKHNGIKNLFDVPVDRYIADFELFGSQVCMDMDGYQFSIAFEKTEIRDIVIDALQNHIKC